MAAEDGGEQSQLGKFREQELEEKIGLCLWNTNTNLEQEPRLCNKQGGSGKPWLRSGCEQNGGQNGVFLPEDSH